MLSLTKNEGLILQSERFGKRIATENVDDYKVVGQDQIVYNPYVIWEGAVHILKKYEHGLVSPVYPVWEARPMEADATFVDAFLRTPLAIAAYNRFAAGAVNRRRAIRKKDFLSIQVPLPPLAEQRIIAHVLRTVQEAIETTEHVIEAARELKRSLMNHLFTYGPVPVDEAEQIPLKDTDIGPVPEHWDIQRFDELVEIATGQVDPKTQPYSEMPHVGPENIEAATGKILSTRSAKELGLISGKYFFSTQDVLYSKIRPYLRKAALPTFDGICSADMYPVRPLDGTLTRAFLYYCLLTEQFTGQAISYQNRTGIPKINRTQLGATLLPLPPITEQEHVSQILSAVDQKIKVEENRKRTLEVFFKTLLHNLMTGKLRVADLNLSTVEEMV